MSEQASTLQENSQAVEKGCTLKPTKCDYKRNTKTRPG